MSRRAWLLAGAGALLVLMAIVGHVAFWYLPRERATTPAAGGACQALLLDGSLSYRVWLAYPHQNLPLLEGDAEEGRALLAALSALVSGERGAAPDDLPRFGFGPFALPPAREMTLAWHRSRDPARERFQLAARLYPSMSLVGKLAGKVASNPWLGGGEVEVGGRRLRVEWRGRDWLVGTADGRGSGAPGGDAGLASPPALALVGISQSPLLVRLGLGDGLYRFAREAPARDLVLARLGAPPSGAAELEQAGAALLEGGLTLVTLSGPGGPLGPLPAALLVRDQPVLEGELRLPGAAALRRAGGERFELPGESLVRRLGLELRQGRANGWEVVALDSRSRDLGIRLAPQVDALLGAAGGPRPLRLGIWLRPRALYETASQLRRALEAVPLLPDDEARRWRHVETVLRPARRLERIEAVALVEGELRVRLVPGGMAGGDATPRAIDRNP